MIYNTWKNVRTACPLLSMLCRILQPNFTGKHLCRSRFFHKVGKWRQLFFCEFCCRILENIAKKGKRQKQPPEVFYKKKLKNFAIFTGKHLCLSLFNKVFLIKKRLQHKCFPVNIVKFLRTPILKNIFIQLLPKRPP